MSWDDMTKNSKAWPSVTEVREYRRQVHAAVRNVILTHPEFSTLATKVREGGRQGWRGRGKEGREGR